MRKRRRWIVLVLLLLIVLGLVSRLRSGGDGIRTGSYLLVHLQGGLDEAPPADLIGTVLAESGPNLYDVLLRLRAAARDERIAGLVLRVGALDLGWGKAREVRDAILAFRRSEKPVIAVLEQEVLASNMEYYVASAADRLHLAPASSAPLTGLGAQFMFLGGMWDKLDIEVHVEKIREYKTMGDVIAFDEMTPEHREMATSLLDGIDGEFVGAIASARGLDEPRVRELIDLGLGTPQQYDDAGLSDGVKYLRTVHDSLGGDQTPLVELEDYADVDVTELGLNVGRKVGVLYASGSIMTGESGTGLTGRHVGADTMAEAFAEIAAADDIEALVVRVDSPGGSALASDLIWRSRRTVQEKMPVVVSMSDVAASGGYYIAVGADRIVAQPTTLTGSIGVVVMRPMIREFLAGAGINVEHLSRGKFAHLTDLTVPLDEAARAKLAEQAEHIYAEFVDRVASGRKMTVERVDEVGRGRVWTGAQALEQGLVDELGGFWDAIDAAKKLAGIDVDEEVELVFFPRPKPLFERVSENLGLSAAASLPQPFADLLRAALPPFTPGTVLALMPYVIQIR